MRQFNRKHDNILWYSKSNNWTFNDNEIRIEHDEKTIENFKEGLKGSGFIGDNYEIPKGKIPEDYWTMAIAARYPKYGIKRVGYPTEKPYTLLERILKACSNEGDLIFDCFMGGGVCQATAMKLGRRFLGADINLGAIQTTTKRLLKNAQLIYQSIQDTPKYTGFEVYNVNHYDIFRNPLEAKDLLMKALEIEPLDASNLYDGEKDGRLVKIIPVNRIATRADLNELITGFDYKAFERRHQANSTKPVEHILLVCRGMNPTLRHT